MQNDKLCYSGNRSPKFYQSASEYTAYRWLNGNLSRWILSGFCFRNSHSLFIIEGCQLHKCIRLLQRMIVCLPSTKLHNFKHAYVLVLMSQVLIKMNTIVFGVMLMCVYGYLLVVPCSIYKMQYACDMRYAESCWMNFCNLQFSMYVGRSSFYYQCKRLNDLFKWTRTSTQPFNNVWHQMKLNYECIWTLDLFLFSSLIRHRIPFIQI